MNELTHQEVVLLLVQLSVLLFFGRMFAEGARKLRQPAVAGELLAGILLGPTILGAYAPGLFEGLFPNTGNSPAAFSAFIQVALVLLLFIAGLEVELHMVLRQGKKAFITTVFGLIVPFFLGFAAVQLFPGFFETGIGKERLVMGLFLGASMAITALPVIVRILMDLDLFKTNVGMLIVASAMISDLVGWIIFSIILSMLGHGGTTMPLGSTILITLGFTIAMLTIGKKLINHALPWINHNFAWPGGLLSITIASCFIWAAFTEYIGIHAIFGAFIFGVAVGESIHFSERAKEIVHHFVNNIFSPLFFVSIGLKVNFIENFSLSLTLVIIALAFIGKIAGSGLGARLSGFSPKTSLAIGFGMNARGAMEIILGLIALDYGLISEKIFVALVIMALVTSITSGPFMKMWIKEPA